MYSIFLSGIASYITNETQNEGYYKKLTLRERALNCWNICPYTSKLPQVYYWTLLICIFLIYKAWNTTLFHVQFQTREIHIRIGEYSLGEFKFKQKRFNFEHYNYFDCFPLFSSNWINYRLQNCMLN